MALLDLVRKSKKTASAKELIEQGVRSALRDSLPMTNEDWVRISSLGSMCPREEVLRSRLNSIRTSGVGSDLGMTFAFGHDIHWVMQNRVMPATGRIVGSWRCTYCGEYYGSLKERLVPRPESCIRCGAWAGDSVRVNNRPIKDNRPEAFLFVEEWIGDHEYMIGGSPDGYFIDNNASLDNYTKEDVVILEFKSAADDSFAKNEKTPDFMHVIQCQCYMWITGFHRAKIIYINKGNSGMEAIMEHDIVFDPETIDTVKTLVREMRIGLSGGAVPKRVACATIGCQRARGCMVSKACFSGDFT